jgi:hypothetical protein
MNQRASLVARLMLAGLLVALADLAGGAGSTPAFAQSEVQKQRTTTAQKQKGKEAPPAQAPAQPAAAPAGAPPMPDTTKMTLLIQNAMAALSQANVTGIYTVLHAFSTPEFQQSHPPEKLREQFQALLKAGIDLTPVILYQPRLTQQPAMDQTGLLRMTGYYETRPQQVQFDLLFRPFSGQWRIHGIAVRTQPVVAQQQPPAGAPAAAPAGGAPPAKPK